MQKRTLLNLASQVGQGQRLPTVVHRVVADEPVVLPRDIASKCHAIQ